jgi:hypothetical protein
VPDELEQRLDDLRAQASDRVPMRELYRRRHDRMDTVQKAVGGWVREAGKRDGAALRALLDAHAATLPRTALHYAVEQLPAAEKAHYLGLRDH